MLREKKLIMAILVAAMSTVGCGGDKNKDSDFTFASGGTGFESTGNPSVSFVPKAPFERFSSFSDLSEDGVYQGNVVFPLVFQYLITPVSSSSFQPIAGVRASDYLVTINGVPVDPRENFSMLQKVVGAPVSLRTALVFDVSSSVDQIDMEKLIEEAKRYIEQAEQSTNPAVANQEYVIWAFAREVESIIRNFTADNEQINQGLDTVLDRFKTGVLGSSSNLHRAILQAVGRYVDEGEGLDFRSDGDNDLVDTTSNTNIRLSQLVLFSAGTDTFQEIEQSLMVDAIQSQGFAKLGSADIDAELMNKPVFYYVVGGDNSGSAYTALADEAEKVTQLQLQSDRYTFAEGLVNDQISAIEARVNLNQLYLYRFGFLPRLGEHEVVFESPGTDSSRRLTTDVTEEYLEQRINLGTPAEELATLVEITGPNGEYLAESKASFSAVKTFGAATRWVNEAFNADSYEWAILSGAAQGRANANGTFTITSKEPGDVVLQVRNTDLEGQFANKNTTTIVVTN